MTPDEQRFVDYCEQIITAGILYKLLAAEKNEAAESLLLHIKAWSLGRHIHEINEEWSKRPEKSIFAGAKILAPLI
jgi:hypothetical protein